jgi:hypothetical protein
MNGVNMDLRINNSMRLTLLKLVNKELKHSVFDKRFGLKKLTTLYSLQAKLKL